jgi:hypothetical protein
MVVMFVIVVFVVNGTFRTIPTVESYGAGVFVPARTLIAVKLLKHVERQMVEIGGGLGNKMEDWVEKQHQMGKRERMRFRTMHNLQKRVNTRARVLHCNSDPVVVSQTLEVNGGRNNMKSEGRQGAGWIWCHCIFRCFPAPPSEPFIIAPPFFSAM